jgi:hypothetical protein
MAASLSSSEFEGNLAPSRDAHLRAQKNCTLDVGAMGRRARWAPAGHPPLRHDIHDMAWTLATNSLLLLALLRSRSLPRLPAQPGLIIMAGGGAAPSTCALDLDGAEPASQQPSSLWHCRDR